MLLLLLSHFSRVRLCNPTDRSPPGSAAPGNLQTRTLEWAAISFSNAWKWKVKANSLSRVWLFTTPWAAAYQTSPSMGFSRQEYWIGVSLPSPRRVYRNNQKEDPQCTQRPMNWCQQSEEKRLRHNQQNLRQNGYLPTDQKRWINWTRSILEENGPKRVRNVKHKYNLRIQRSEHLRWHPLMDMPVAN